MAFVPFNVSTASSAGHYPSTDSPHPDSANPVIRPPGLRYPTRKDCIISIDGRPICLTTCSNYFVRELLWGLPVPDGHVLVSATGGLCHIPLTPCVCKILDADYGDPSCVIEGIACQDRAVIRADSPAKGLRPGTSHLPDGTSAILCYHISWRIVYQLPLGAPLPVDHEWLTHDFVCIPFNPLVSAVIAERMGKPMPFSGVVGACHPVSARSSTLNVPAKTVPSLYYPLRPVPVPSESMVCPGPVNVPQTLDVATPVTAPLDTAPLDTAPLDTAPLDTAPLDTAPLDTAPLDTAPLDTAPLDTAPLDTAPLDTAPVIAKRLGSAVHPQSVLLAASTGWSCTTYASSLESSRTSSSSSSAAAGPVDVGSPSDSSMTAASALTSLCGAMDPEETKRPSVVRQHSAEEDSEDEELVDNVVYASSSSSSTLSSSSSSAVLSYHAKKKRKKSSNSEWLRASIGGPASGSRGFVAICGPRGGVYAQPNPVNPRDTSSLLEAVCAPGLFHRGPRGLKRPTGVPCGPGCYAHILGRVAVMTAKKRVKCPPPFLPQGHLLGTDISDITCTGERGSEPFFQGAKCAVLRNSAFQDNRLLRSENFVSLSIAHDNCHSLVVVINEGKNDEAYNTLLRMPGARKAVINVEPAPSDRAVSAIGCPVVYDASGAIVMRIVVVGVSFGAFYAVA